MLSPTRRCDLRVPRAARAPSLACWPSRRPAPRGSQHDAAPATTRANDARVGLKAGLHGRR